jgi:hypothetical protein
MRQLHGGACAGWRTQAREWHCKGFMNSICTC